MRKWGELVAFAAGVLIVSSMTVASPIKNWTSNEYIQASDLNTVVNHLHANLGHGHGPIITANDIASNAGIRPEQTTFGSTINRSLVFEGTFKINPDAGSIYLPVNGAGSLAVTVTKISTTGVSIDAVAAAGANPDAGNQIYTVMYQAVGYTIGDSTMCNDQGAPTLLYSPLHVPLDCRDLTDTTWPLNMKNPTGIAVTIFSNKVQ